MEASEIIFGVIFAFIVIVLEIETDPIIVGGLSNIPSQFASIILVVRFVEVILVVFAFIVPSVKDRFR